MNNDTTEPQDGNLSPSPDTITPNQQDLPNILGKTIKVPEDQINAGSRAALPQDEAVDLEEDK